MAQKFVTVNVTKAVKQLTILSKRTDKENDISLFRAGLLLEAEVKKSIAGQRSERRSVDTGQFLSSVETVRKKQDIVAVRSTVQHAAPLEFGTSRGAPPRRHFGNSLRRMTPKIIKFLAKEQDKIT